MAHSRRWWAWAWRRSRSSPSSWRLRRDWCVIWAGAWAAGSCARCSSVREPAAWPGPDRMTTFRPLGHKGRGLGGRRERRLSHRLPTARRGAVPRTAPSPAADSGHMRLPARRELAESCKKARRRACPNCRSLGHKGRDQEGAAKDDFRRALLGLTSPGASGRSPAPARDRRCPGLWGDPRRRPAAMGRPGPSPPPGSWPC